MDAITIRTETQVTPARTFGPELIQEFLSWVDRTPRTARTYLTNIRQFAVWLRYASIRQPRREDVISFRSWLSTEHDAIQSDDANPAGWSYRTDAAGNPIRITLKANTVAQYLRSVCAFFRWTASNGLYPDIAANIHAPKIKHDVHRKAAFTPEEVMKIEQSIAARAEERTQAAHAARKDAAGRVQRADEQSRRLLAIYLLAVNAGLRTIEISRANVRDLETMSGQTWLYIWGKGHAEPDQRKPLAPEVAQTIRDYLATRPDHPTGASPLFTATGNRSGGRRLSETTISKLLKQAMKDAGFDSERLTAHSLRHTAGTAIQSLTGDLYATQHYMRHANPATTEIYLHNDTETQEAAIASKLYDLYHGRQVDQRDQLADKLARMTPEQLDQLAAIADAMT